MDAPSCVRQNCPPFRVPRHDSWIQSSAHSRRMDDYALLQL